VLHIKVTKLKFTPIFKESIACVHPASFG
jgi:hypothetical protein